MNYYILTDEENKDVVVKSEGRDSFEAVFGTEEKWRYKGMLSYFNESSPRYEKYEEITEEEAWNLIKSQDDQLTTILEMLNRESASDKIKATLGKDFDKEQKVVYLLFLLGKNYIESHQDLIAKLPRLEKSVNCLINHVDRLNESDLIELRVHRNTRLISVDYYERQFANKRITEDKFNIVRDFLLQKIDRLDDRMVQILSGTANQGTISNSAKNMWMRIQGNVLGGAKVPHSTSQPVIRKENGKYYLAVFTFLYNREDIEAGMVSRPTVWALADLETGEIVHEYETKEKDFSDAPYDVKYNVRADAQYDTSKEYYDKAFAILDSVREKLISTGKLYSLEYKAYLDRILANIPKEYQRFYRDLSI